MDKNYFNLHEVIKDTAYQAGMRTGEKPVWLDIMIEPSVPQRFEGDSEIIQRILLSLLASALRCMRIGTLKLLAQSTPESATLHRISITVADRNKGLTADQLENLFRHEPDRQQDQNDEDEWHLHNSRALARAMGGDMYAKSWTDIGSDFTLVLPLRCAQPLL